MTQPFSVGQSSDTYCRPALIAFGNTAQQVGTIFIHCPVANSSTMKITPLTIHRMSSDWWNHRFRLILRLRVVARGDQNTVGRFSVRTCSPERMISTIRNTLKKCCQPEPRRDPDRRTLGQRVLARVGGEEVLHRLAG